MYFSLIIILAALFSIIYVYNYGKNILSYQFNQPKSSQQTILEDAIDECFNYQTNEYCVLNNVSLPSYNSSPILIDTLLISTSGVYIVQLSNIQGQIKYNKQHSLEKLRKGRYEKLFIHSQVDQSLIDKLQCYLPDIEQKNINFVTLFNNGTVFTSKVPHHIDIIETFIFKLKQNAGVLSMHDLIVPIGMLVSRMDKIESAEDDQKKSA